MCWYVRNKTVLSPPTRLKLDPIKLEIVDSTIDQQNIKNERSSTDYSNSELEDKSFWFCFCNVCCEFFDTKELLEAHKIEVHYRPVPKICGYDKTQNTCKKFARRLEVLNHPCEKVKLGKEYFLDPQNRLPNEKSYKCYLCNKFFTTKQRLITHNRTHTGEKPYKCDQCDKSFTVRHYLIVHNRTHTGEKPYKCQLCDKRFSQKPNLAAHYRTHLGEKLYSCKLCDKRYTRKEYLISHNRSHTGDKPYKCVLCNKSFINKRAVNFHNKAHTEDELLQIRSIGPLPPGT